MKQKRMAIVAVACGMVCAACVALFLVSVRGEADAARAEALARYGGEQVEACVATRDIVAGERVDLSAVETKLWVADLLPERSVRSVSDAVGKTATSPIYKGEVITSGRFDYGHDSIEVPAGKQAVSVPARAVQAVGGAIKPGMSVDIYSSGDSTTVAIAKGVNVLDTSVNASGSLTSSDNGFITIAIDPEKVQEIIAASSKTTLYFALPGASLEDEANADSSLGQMVETTTESTPESASASSAELEAEQATGSAASQQAENPGGESRGEQR